MDSFKTQDEHQNTYFQAPQNDQTDTFYQNNIAYQNGPNDQASQDRGNINEIDEDNNNEIVFDIDPNIKNNDSNYINLQNKIKESRRRKQEE